MSHNQTTINNQTPDSSSDISISLTSLSDVSGVPASGQVLQYDGSGWLPASSSMNTSLPYSMHADDRWGYSGALPSYSVGQQHTFSLGGAASVAPYNGINGGPYGTDPFWEKAATPDSPFSSIYWNMGFNLPAGDWLAIGTPNTRFASSSDSIDWAWFDGAGNQYGNRVKAISGRPNSVACWAIVSIEDTTQIFLKCMDVSGTVSLTASDTQKSIAFQFIKLG
ncbi:hypothetical protein CMI37_34000 [Candidatus Pacearchaeota archaeon]|nr:hypothetical protein [Candidatus Pacearchaeota archaeon]|tara:strand:+ start:996 stop:1664 length:669 start_codon:yes stop_codon:yes gene_type:complete